MCWSKRRQGNKQPKENENLKQAALLKVDDDGDENASKEWLYTDLVLDHDITFITGTQVQKHVCLTI